MEEFTHAFEHVTSQHLLQAANTSKLYVHLITQRLKQHHGARLFHRRRKKAADGSLGSLALKIFHQ
jgi:hypothetical protein